MTTPDTAPTTPDAARLAYATLEPIHLVTYFGPRVDTAVKELGLHWRASYVGMRAEPMGHAHGSVVAAAFYNWQPAKLTQAWDEACAAGLDRLAQVRGEVVVGALSDAGVDRELAGSVAERLRSVYAQASPAGRPLAAAWLAAEWPEDPLLALWQACTIEREWRGDGHIAALITAGLGPVECLAFHEAEHPDPSVKASRMGRDATIATRGWSRDEWETAEQALAERDLLQLREGTRPVLTEAGTELYAAVEELTDDAASGVWDWATEDPQDLLAQARRLAKPVIDAGILPGTAKR